MTAAVFLLTSGVKYLTAKMSYNQQLYEWQSNCARQINEYVTNVRAKQIATVAAVAVCCKFFNKTEL